MERWLWRNLHWWVRVRRQYIPSRIRSELIFHTYPSSFPCHFIYIYFTNSSSYWVKTRICSMVSMKRWWKEIMQQPPIHPFWSVGTPTLGESRRHECFIRYFFFILLSSLGRFLYQLRGLIGIFSAAIAVWYCLLPTSEFTAVRYGVLYHAVFFSRSN